MYKFQFFPLHCPSRNAISSKLFNEFSKTFLLAEGWWRWLLWLKISSTQTILVLQLETLPLSQPPAICHKFQFFPLDGPSRNALSSKVFNEFSKTFFWPNDKEGGYCRWKFQFHRCFGFPMATLQLFQHLENVEISIFPLYTVPAEMLYLQKFLTNFKKLFFWPNDEEGGHCGWKLQLHRYFGFAITTLQLFQHPENVKISIFPFTLSRQKCHVFKSV